MKLIDDGSVLITGGTGTIGSAIAKLLPNRRICIFSRGEAMQARMRNQVDGSRFRFFIGDVRDLPRLRRAMQGCDVVYHCAALKRIEVGDYDPIEMVKTNVMGSTNVIEASMDVGVQSVVCVSTDKAYEPISPYGYSKALADSLFFAANNYSALTKFSVVRLGNVAGSTGSVIPTWSAMKRAPITDPDCTRFWMTPLEAAEAVIKGESPAELPAYRLGDLAKAMGVETYCIGLRSFEKKHELLRPGVSSENARRMSIQELREALCNL